MPGGGVARRPLHFIIMGDCSGSMKGPKMQALNTALRAMLPHLLRWEREQLQAQLLVRILGFATEPRWHVPEPTPVAELNDRWRDLEYVRWGWTNMGPAFEAVGEVLEPDRLETRALRPAILLVTDGLPTDPPGGFERGLAALTRHAAGRLSLRSAGTRTPSRWTGSVAVTPRSWWRRPSTSSSTGWWRRRSRSPGCPRPEPTAAPWRSSSCSPRWYRDRASTTIRSCDADVHRCFGAAAARLSGLVARPDRLATRRGTSGGGPAQPGCRRGASGPAGCPGRGGGRRAWSPASLPQRPRVPARGDRRVRGGPGTGRAAGRIPDGRTDRIRGVGHARARDHGGMARRGARGC